MVINFTLAELTILMLDVVWSYINEPLMQCF